MDETIVLFIKYRDNIELYNQMHRFHFLKRRRIKKQIDSIKKEIQSYNTPDKIFSFVNGIYVLVSTVLYGHMKDETCMKNIKITDRVLEIKLDNGTFIWFMTKTQSFQISDFDILYSIYKNQPPKNTKVMERWIQTYPKIFSILWPIITIQDTRRENK